MSLKTSLLLFLLSIFITSVTANNITHAFEKYSNFSTMSNLLLKTKLTLLINKYQTITILAINNEAITTITNRSDIELKNILMTHIVLDYYDELKLKGLKEKSIMLTTLYQTTGLGEEMNGFINCTKSKGRVFFGSEVKNSSLTAEYVKTLYHNPFNLSIIEITMPIVAPGLSFAVNPPPPPPAPLAPAPSPMDGSPSPSPSPMNAPTPSDDNTHVPKTPPTRESPETDESPAPAPNADDEKMEAADKAKPPSSSACNTGLSLGVVFLLAFYGGLRWV